MKSCGILISLALIVFISAACHGPRGPESTPTQPNTTVPDLAPTPAAADDEPAFVEPAAAEWKALQRRVAVLLASEEKRDQTWGAWYVARHHLADLCPTVNTLLTNLLGRENTESDQLLVSALLDALIQNQFKPGHTLLVTLWRKYHQAEALALAEPFAKHHAPFLASIIGESERAYQVAICNLLMQGNERLFVESVLPRIHLTLDLMVLEDGIKSKGWGRKLINAGAGDGMVRREPDLPPHVLYTVSLSTTRVFGLKKGDLSVEMHTKVLCTGPRTAYLKRYVYWKEAWNGSSHRGNDRRNYWRDCLLDSLERDEMGKLAMEHKEVLRWTDLAALRREVVAARASLRAPWLKLCRHLQKEKLLSTDADLDELFAVSMTLWDEREKKDPPLFLALPDRSPTENERREIELLIQRLGEDDDKIRDGATRRLVALGRIAKEALYRATKNEDTEVRNRAQKILSSLFEPRRPQAGTSSVRFDVERNRTFMRKPR